MKKITVIIPCYNAERTLGRCLDSVIAQTYKNFEVLFINDASKDKSLSIAKSYAAKDERIRIIDCPLNKGVSASRNLGLESATGDYIQFLDADDEFVPDTLATLMNAIEKNNADLAVCNFTGNPIFQGYFGDRVFDMSVRNDVFEYYQETFCIVLPWNKLYKREALTVRFDEKVHFAEDELFNLAALGNVKRIVTVSKPLYIYHFAPAENVAGSETASKSCLNKIIDETSVGEKNSIWYMGRHLIPIRKKIIEKQLKGSGLNYGKTENLLYTRAFDFLFWELSAFAFMNAGREQIINEFADVFNEREFIKSMKVQERYGVKFIRYDDEELYHLTELYINICLDMYNDIKLYHPNIKFYIVFLHVFTSIFCRYTDKKCEDYNQLYKYMIELDNISTPEAQYTYSWFEVRTERSHEAVLA